MYQCDNCNKEFTKKCTLNRHKRESKKCINQNIVNKVFDCEFCNKNLSTNQRLITHKKTCKKNKEEKVIDRLTRKIEELTIKMHILEKKQPTNITINNTTNNDNSNTTTNILNNYNTPLIDFMTTSLVKETFEQNYTIKDLSGSQKGLATFTSKHFLSGKDKPLYTCTDRSRQRFFFRDGERKDVEDQNAIILIELVSKGFGSVKKLYEKQLKDLNKKLEKYRKEDRLTMIGETIDEINKLKENYQQILEIKNEGDNYRIQLSKILPSSIDNRLLKDATIERLEEDIEESDTESESEKDEKVDEKKMPILHDKTALHIGNITYGGLKMYKDHYQQTGKILMHPHFRDNEEYQRQFLEYIHSA